VPHLSPSRQSNQNHESGSRILALWRSFTPSDKGKWVLIFAFIHTWKRFCFVKAKMAFVLIHNCGREPSPSEAPMALGTKITEHHIQRCNCRSGK
jgi:hypothetical protein